MDIMQIKCFWAVINTGNFTEAGEILHISQSATSKKIRALEEELGIDLLNRNGKYFTVSDAGRKMMRYFAEIIETFDHAMLELADIKRSNADGVKKLKIIGVPVIGRCGIIPLINTFSKAYSDIEVTVNDMEEDRLLLMLQSGDCDIAFCSDLKLDSEHYGIQHVYSETFMAATNYKNELALRSSIKLKDLENKRLVLNKRESMLLEVCVNACYSAGFTPNVVMTTARPDIAFEYLRDKDDCVYMGLKKATFYSRVITYPSMLIEDAPRFNYVFAWKLNKGLSKSASQFLEYARNKYDTITSLQING